MVLRCIYSFTPLAMDTKNNTVIIGLLTLLLGLAVGYGLGTANAPRVVPSAGMHGAMSGMMMELEGKTGAELERAFLDGMIIHHEGAIEMANVLLRSTERPELIKLGNDIISAQMGEIEMMKRWRSDWF